MYTFIRILVESNGSSSSELLDHPDTVPEMKQTSEEGQVCREPVLVLPCSFSLPVSLSTTDTGEVTASGEAAVGISDLEGDSKEGEG